MAQDLQQRETQHGQWRFDAGPETEKRRAKSINQPRQKRGDYPATSGVTEKVPFLRGITITLSSFCGPLRRKLAASKGAQQRFLCAINDGNTCDMLNQIERLETYLQMTQI